MPPTRAEVGAGVADVDLSGRTVLVTGATDGIGRETALSLGRLGARVLVHGRDREKGRSVLDALSETDADGVELYLADFASLSSVRELVAEIDARHDRLDVLVNNAGGYFPTPRLAEEGVEYTFAVNHLAPFLLTNRLLPLVEGAPGGRIVTVSSDAHQGGRVDLSRVRTVEGYDSWRAYARSKLANVLFAYELARRLAPDGVDVGGRTTARTLPDPVCDPGYVTSNCLHPGVVPGTAFNREMSAPVRVGMAAFSLLPSILTRPFATSVVEGAETTVYLAVSPRVAGVTGRYFVRCRPRRSARASYDRATAERLWDVSAELTDLDGDRDAASRVTGGDPTDR